MDNQGLRKEIRLPGMIAMAAGGMIAAWMVEIKYWFEIGGAGAALSLLTCAILILPLAFMYTEMTSTDAICRWTEYMDYQRIRI